MAEILEKQYVSPDEAEVIYGPSKWTFRRYAYQGIFPSVKFGTRLLIPVKAIEDFMAARTRPSTAEGTRMRAEEDAA